VPAPARRAAAGLIQEGEIAMSSTAPRLATRIAGQEVEEVAAVGIQRLSRSAASGVASEVESSMSGRLARYGNLEYLENVANRASQRSMVRAQAVQANQRKAGYLAEDYFEKYAYQLQLRMMKAESPYRITTQAAADISTGERVLARTKGSFRGGYTEDSKRLDYGIYSRFQGRANTAPILSGADYTVTPGGAFKNPLEYSTAFPNTKVFKIDPKDIYTKP
jgi:hypothetical protein